MNVLYYAAMDREGVAQLRGVDLRARLAPASLLPRLRLWLLWLDVASAVA